MNGLRRLILLLVALVLGACVQTENSSSLDRETYGNDDSLFGAARTIIGSNCSACHAYHTMTEAELISAGLIVAGEPENSKIYYRLTGSTGSAGPKNMPSGSALSSQDREAISAWIEGIEASLDAAARRSVPANSLRRNGDDDVSG